MYLAISHLGNTGKDAFIWKVIAEGEYKEIKLLKHALIKRSRTNELGGFSAVGGYYPASINFELLRQTRLNCEGGAV